MATLTFAMIVKNEEKNLAQLLKSVKDVADEIVIVDTGSTDRSVEIAESFGAKVIHHRWNLNMSAARDEYIRAATMEWILVLDGDERIAARDMPRIKPLLDKNPGVMGFFLAKRDYGFPGVQRPAHDPYTESAPYESWMNVREIRLFRNDKRLHYAHHVHTNIIQAIQKLKGTLADLQGIPIHHFRQKLTPQEKERKHKLYIQMLELEVLENPTDPAAYGHLAAEFGPQDIEKSIANYEKAVALIRKRKALSKKPWSYHFAIVGELGRIYMERREIAKARELFELAVELDSQEPRHYSSLGEIELVQGDLEKSREHFLRARELHHPNTPYINSRLNTLAEKLGLVEYYF